MLDLPEPHVYWWRFFSNARRQGSNLLDVYGTAAHELIVQLNLHYLQCDLEGMIHCKEYLLASRRWCQEEPLRSKYELMFCRVAFYFTMYELDNFIFDRCVDRFRMVDQIIEEKRERRERLGLPALPESYMKLDILMAKTDAKWKAPTPVAVELPAVPIMMSEFQELNTRIIEAKSTVSQDISIAFANVSVSLLLGACRFQEPELKSWAKLLESVVGVDAANVMCGRNEHEGGNHWYWRVRAGKAYIDRSLEDGNLDHLEHRILSTARDIAIGRSAEEYVLSCQRELSWLRKAQRLSLLT